MAKILLVEDDNNLREIYEARLQAEGYEIMSAHDGEEALVVAKEKKPDLIIADIMMPKISGFEMVDILRNTAGLQEVKIIMLTALGQAEDQEKAKSLGADRYLVKSQVTLEDIVNAARELLGSEGEAQPSAASPTPDAAQAAAGTQPPATPADSAQPTAAAEPGAATAEVPTIVETHHEDPATPPPAPGTSAATDAQPAPSETATEATDDKLINDAVTSLEGNASSSATDPAIKPDPTPAATTPTTYGADAMPSADPAADPNAPDPANTDPVSTDTPAPDTTLATPPATDAGTTDATIPPIGQPATDADSSLQVSKGLEELLKKDNEPEAGGEPPTAGLPGAPEADMQEASSSDPSNPNSPDEEKSSDYLSDTSGPLIESNPGSSMKVIKPIPVDKNKPDIKTLLEQEELNQGPMSLDDTGTGAPADDTSAKDVTATDSAATTPAAPAAPADPAQPAVVAPNDQTEAPGNQIKPDNIAI